MKVIFIILSLVFLLPLNLHAEPVEFESGEKAVELIELYTSEGCSSCPPAENWITDLKSHSKLFKEFVPVAFHVDYWDYLGWKDDFARSAYGARQYTFRRQGLVGGVYTPELVVSGKEWRSWFRGDRTWPESSKKVGNLKVEIKDNLFRATYSEDLDAPVINAAILGFDFEREIGAGENRGRVLHQDFIVLDYVSKKNKLDQWLHLPKSKIKSPSKTAVVFWVEEDGLQVPIQATGGFYSYY